MKIKFFAALLFVAVFSSAGVYGKQAPEITISLNENFFDAVIDAVFQHGNPPEFSIASMPAPSDNERLSFIPAMFSGLNWAGGNTANANCRDAITLQRQSGGVNTAVRFRGGRILAPLAFNGGYTPPLVGCVAFSGWAESNLTLEFDRANQRLIARAGVLNVHLNEARGIGGNLIARMVQNSIDSKINPIEIIRMDKISFLVPLQNSGNVRMNATGVRHDITEGRINIHIAYEFVKG